MAKTISLNVDSSGISEFLQPYIQSGNISFLLGSGASMPAIPTAGSIETDIDALLKEDKKAEANLKALALIETLRGNPPLSTDAIPSVDAAQTLKSYVYFLQTVDRLLFERKNLLLPRQANLFTTNYDLFIERAAEEISTLTINDGFVRSPANGSQFPFAPERYFDRVYRAGGAYNHPSEVPTINLIKLHGSLSWRRAKDLVVYDATPIPELSADDQKDPDKVSSLLEKYFLILPNLQKFHSAMMERVYYDLLRIYANTLDLENALLICFGFSFADEHILDITRRALRNPTAQLLIFSYEHDVAGFEEKFSAQRNVSIVAPEGTEKINLERLSDLLNLALPGT